MRDVPIRTSVDRVMNVDAIAELRPFVRDGKLVQIPRRHSTRLILLDRLAQQFDPGRHYSEIEVNEVLCAVHFELPRAASLPR